MMNGIIRSILCCCNPRINLSNTHHVWGWNLALFSSFAEVENSLTCLTSSVKNNCSNLRLNSKK